MHIKHLFKQERESQFDQELNNGNAKASGNGTKGSTAFNDYFDTLQPVELVSGIKAELEKARLLTTPEAQDKVFQLERLAQILQIGFKNKLAAAEQIFKSERQRLLAIVEQMRQAPDVDTLLRTTVTEVRQHLQVDRALIYRDWGESPRLQA